VMTFFHIKRMVFLSIQTAGIARELKDLPKRMQELWIKANKWKSESDYDKLFRDESGLMAEFGQIVQVNMGRIKEGDDQIEDGNLTARIISIEGNEEKILQTTVEILDRIVMANLCGHFIKEFTIPFLVKRLRIQGIKRIPECIDTFGKRPWEVTCLDTSELWQAGGKGRTSLKLIAEVMGLNGEDVSEDQEESVEESIHHLYWAGDYAKIRSIGQQKTLSTMNLLLSLNGKAKIKNIELEIKDEKLDTPGDSPSSQPIH